jgi:hypothetical protein
MEHVSIFNRPNSARHRALRTTLAVLCAGAAFAPAAQAFNPQPDPPGRQPELTSHPASIRVTPTFTVQRRQLRPFD